MTNKKKEKKPTLTRGLEAIFDGDISDIFNEKEISKLQGDSKRIYTINVNEIRANPYQPRHVFNQEKLEELAISIQENGLLSPIALKKTRAGGYYIVSGERRWRASKLGNLETIDAIVLDVTDRKMEEFALIENIQREDLNPIEEAKALKKLIEKHELTHEKASKILGKSRTYITNALRLLKLNDSITKGVLENKLNYGHIKPLIGLEDNLALKIYKRILDEDLTVRNVENIVRGYKLSDARKNSPKKQKEPKTSSIEYVEDLIRNKVKSKVDIEKKKIIIKYKDDDHLNRILKRLNIID